MSEMLTVYTRHPVDPLRNEPNRAHLYSDCHKLGEVYSTTEVKRDPGSMIFFLVPLPNGRYSRYRLMACLFCAKRARNEDGVSERHWLA